MLNVLEINEKIYSQLDQTKETFLTMFHFSFVYNTYFIIFVLFYSFVSYSLEPFLVEKNSLTCLYFTSLVPYFLNFFLFSCYSNNFTE